MSINPEEAAALAFVPHGKAMMDTLRDLLPEGTDFGVYILVRGETEGRLLALNTNRATMVPAVAQWVLSALPDKS